MNVFKSLGVLLLLSVLVSAYCDYGDKLNITNIYISNEYPSLGEEISIKIDVDSGEYLTSPLRIFLNEGYFTQILVEDDLYISKGRNNFEYKIKISENFCHSLGILDVRVGNVRKTYSFDMENEFKGIISELENEENYTLILESETPIKFRIDSESSREITVRPIENVIKLNVKKCEMCEIVVSFEYKNEKYSIYKRFGEYVKPYTYINGIGNNEIEIVNCPSEEVEKRTYETGYEKIRGEVYEFDLSKFTAGEVNEIKILEVQPLTFMVTARDELNREIASKGILFLECEINSFTNEIEFVGEREFVYNFNENTTCDIIYGTAKVNSESIVVQNDKETEQNEVIYWDDYITYGLVLITIVIMIVLFNRWRGMNRKKW